MSAREEFDDLDDLMALLDRKTLAVFVRLVLSAHFRKLANVDAAIVFRGGITRAASECLADFSIGEHSALHHCDEVATLAIATMNIAAEGQLGPKRRHDA